jgi:hypothetical protein
MMQAFGPERQRRLAAASHRRIANPLQIGNSIGNLPPQKPQACSLRIARGGLKSAAG